VGERNESFRLQYSARSMLTTVLQHLSCKTFLLDLDVACFLLVSFIC